ncbi:hypothetical protein BH09PSE4_BH09PSE4_16270 [soil metagenome]
MKWALICGLPAVVAGGIYVGAGNAETYPLPIDQVSSTLETMSLPDYVEGTMNFLPDGGSTRTAVAGKSVTYYFQARGGQAAKFVANLEAVDATHTRVSTKMEMAANAEELMKTKYMPVAKEFASMGAATMREQIDARLEKRPFDKKVADRARAGFLMANMGTIQKSASEAMDEAVKLQDQSHASSTASTYYDPSKPMVDPTPAH